VIVLGIILIVIFGWLIPIALLFDLGIVLVVIGVVLLLLGYVGHPVGGRSNYW
jgi:hypothetical protein